ncbi:M48 family metallopeptidase [Nitrosomonas supralitoralis]|uniref:M48 family peptidase n=1 Tax=Nitrosomonas supralitoralis TaxID=2116706 RepID=A0A2P7NUK2_9PROT|nr:SprT family zinc-dependent metalloprotease [Nitrosomonas supralitoralis]PSJ17115.1 M48 family peptidase [Nitrosomonas supralitoralis]
MLTQTILNGREITYSIKRCKRKSIGLKIDHQGLCVSVPLQTVLPHVEIILKEKADWITKKLEQWENKKSLAISWTRDAIYPLLGEPWRIALNSSGEIEMARHFSNETANMTIAEQSMPQLDPHQIEKFVMAWYSQQAIICFKQRIVIYAQALNISVPPFRLSRAKTRWGSCNSRGLIHLNWRLIQMPLHLVDYVVVHELSHLIEMNHSARFWKLVGGVYLDYQAARKQLKDYA